MIAIRQIIAPVDFSELSAHALRYAFMLASRWEAGLTAAYADPFTPPPYFTQHRLAALKLEFEQAKAESEEALREFVAAALGHAGRAVTVRVAEALPADGIHRMAAETAADLIVMGTHGRSGVNRFLLGSVAERVLRESSIPVLTVGARSSHPTGIREILCPVNDTPAARRALAWATALAARFGASVTALHVQEPAGAHPIEDLCAWLPEQEKRACTLRELHREGDAAGEIVAMSRESGCELLVLGSEHRAFFDSTVVGATVARVVRHARCPVLTAPAA